MVVPRKQPQAGLRRRQLAGLAGAFWLGAGVASAHERRLRILTEEFPPYNYTVGGRITGLGTDVVEAVLQEIGVKGDIRSMPWARAYQTARDTPSVLIYSIARTPERDPLFKWVGVIAPAHYYLFSLPGKSLRIDSLEAAKAYQIGTVNDAVGEQFLVAQGFVKGVNLQSSMKYEHNYEKLQRGRVDLWIMSEYTAHHLARQAGDDPDRTLAKTLHIPDLSREGYYMAFGRQTPDELVLRFRNGLEAIKRNGTYDRLQRKWR